MDSLEMRDRFQRMKAFEDERILILRTEKTMGKGGGVKLLMKG